MPRKRQGKKKKRKKTTLKWGSLYLCQSVCDGNGLGSFNLSVDMSPRDTSPLVTAGIPTIPTHSWTHIHFFKFMLLKINWNNFSYFIIIGEPSEDPSVNKQFRISFIFRFSLTSSAVALSLHVIFQSGIGKYISWLSSGTWVLLSVVVIK